jgi:AcrR family transcriptional regulator
MPPSSNSIPQASNLVESKRELRKRELRSRIIDAAMGLFTEKGFADTTIDEICTSADVARRTLYAYFPTKNDIVRSLCRSLVIDETINIIELAIEQHQMLSDRLQFMTAGFRRNLSDADPLQKALVQQLVNDQSDPGESNVLLMVDLKKAFTALFSSAEDSHGLSPTMSPELSAEILISVISAISINWIHDKHYPLNENLAEIEAYLIQNLR